MSERRRAEIAEKRARLAALKQARQDREQSTRQQLASSSTTPSGTLTDRDDSRPNSRIGGGNKQDEIESLLRGVGVPPTPRTSIGPGADTTPERSTAGDDPRSEPTQTTTEIETPLQPMSVQTPPSMRLNPHPDPRSSLSRPSSEADIPPETDESAPSPTLPPPPPPPPAPNPKVVYDKSIQTTPDLFPYSPTTASTSSGAQTRNYNNEDEEGESGGGAGRETSDELRSRIISELEAERLQLDRDILEEKRLAQLAYDETLKKGLSPPELETIFSSPGFSEFLQDSTKVVQRALSESYDYLRDYTITDEEGREDAEGKRQRVRLLGAWRDEAWGKGRSVTAVDWSPKVSTQPC